MEVFRYEVRDSGHFTSTAGSATGVRRGPEDVVLELQDWDGARLAETLDALDGRRDRTVHVVVPDGGPGVLRAGVRLHGSVAAALSAARARHSPVSAF